MSRLYTIQFLLTLTMMGAAVMQSEGFGLLTTISSANHRPATDHHITSSFCFPTSRSIYPTTRTTRITKKQDWILSSFSCSSSLLVLSSSNQNNQEEEMSSSSPPPVLNKGEEKDRVNVKCPNCNLCDGSGRITGGLGAILPWFPVKAYRPCPNFIERGGIYERSGQGLEEIAFGRESTSNKK